jgi:hypothetical protein
MRADRLERQRTGEPEPFEASELRLRRHAHRARGVDERKAVGEHRRRGLERGGVESALSGRRELSHRHMGIRERSRQLGARLGGPIERVRPQAGRVGIDPEHDLRLAGRDRGGEPVSKRCRVGRRR